MSEDDWARVDGYLASTLRASDAGLDAAKERSTAAGLPAIDVSEVQGKLLMLLCQIAGARSVLEIGTLGGYSATWLARGVQDGGHVLTLELDPHHGQVARTNLDAAGVSDRVDIVVGPAIDTLPTLVDSPHAPFDLVFIDADKPGYPDYLEWALTLSRPGTVIVADNVVRGGRVADDTDEQDATVAVRKTLALLGDDPRIDATAIQTVGTKGWDGFALGVVTSATAS